MFPELDIDLLRTLLLSFSQATLPKRLARYFGSPGLVEQAVANRPFREGMHLPASRRTRFKGIPGRLPYCV
jgi:hypothetical protein